MKKFIAVFCLFLATNCYAISVDEQIPYRIYIGNDKIVDWIDIKTTRQDLSDIEWIDYFPTGKFYLIYKKNSVWKLYLNEDITKTVLRKVDYDEIATLNRYLIYCESVYRKK